MSSWSDLPAGFPASVVVGKCGDSCRFYNFCWEEPGRVPFGCDILGLSITACLALGELKM